MKHSALNENWTYIYIFLWGFLICSQEKVHVSHRHWMNCIQKFEFDPGLIWIWIWSQVTTARKAVTLLLSYLIFTKPLTEQHGTGLLLIGMGIVLKLLPDNKPYKKPPTFRSRDTEKIEDPFPGKIERNEGEDEEMRPLVWNPRLWLFLVFTFYCNNLLFLSDSYNL